MNSFRRGLLSDYFEGVAVKRLSVVETTPSQSNQHEFNGSRPLRKLLGDDDRRKIPARFIWFGDEQEGITDDSTLSWYDSRRNQTHRSAEYRLYYPGNAVSELMKAGDTLFLAMRPDGSAMVIVTPAESTMQNQLLWLFGVEEQPELQFTVREIEADDDAKLDFIGRYVLDELGIEPERPRPADGRKRTRREEDFRVAPSGRCQASQNLLSGDSHGRCKSLGGQSKVRPSSPTLAMGSPLFVAGCMPSP